MYSSQDAVGALYYKKYFNQDEIIYVNSFEKMVQMVAENVAVAVFPSRLMNYSYSSDFQGKIKFLQLEDISFPTMHYIAYKKTIPMRPEIERVKNAICFVYEDLKRLSSK